MALDFPNSPSDGQVYTDTATGEQWVYEAATNSWTSKGLVNTSGGLVYKGTVDITQTPPTASSGWQYSVLADGTANAGFGPGITGAVAKGDIIMYTGTGWTDTSHNVPQATAAVAGIDKKLWKRTGTELSPETAGDDVFTSGDVKVGGTTAAPKITVGADTTAPDNGIYSPGADQVAISTKGKERFSIDSNGRLLVGTSSSSSIASAVLQGNSSFPTGGGLLRLARGSVPGVNTDDLGRLAFSEPNHVTAAEVAAFKDTGTWTSGSSQPTRLVFSTTADGASSPTERMRIDSDGYVRLTSNTGGIQFNGDTAAANALDDYEEGTWTPAFSFATPGDLAVTYSNQTGNYRIVGKLCIATFTLEFTPTYTTSSGTARVTGLPLSTGNYLTTPASVDRFAGFTLTAGFDNMWLRKSTGQTYVELYSMGRSGSPSMGTSEVVSGSAKILNGTIIYNL